MTFTVADGSVAVVLKENSPWALIKGTEPNTWFYAPRAARVERGDSDKPLLAVTRNRRPVPGNPGQLETLGGVFAAQLELALTVPSPQEQAEWTEHIRLVTGIAPGGSTAFRFLPMRLHSGELVIGGCDQYVLDPAKLKRPVAASSTVGVGLELNALGADTFVQALRSSTSQSFPVIVNLQYKYDMVLPRCHYEIRANNRVVFDFYSRNERARASYFGLVGGSYDRQIVRQELIQQGGITITQISPPDGLNNEQIKKLEESIIDMWSKQVLAMIANVPKPDPAVAPNPSGFFGGVSVSIKDWSYVQTLDLTAVYDYQELREELYNVSYVFANLFEGLNPTDYLLDVYGDNELPLTVNLGQDGRVMRYASQFGYRRPDGSYAGGSLRDVSGDNGGVLAGTIQWNQADPRPTTVSVGVSVDWKDPNWEDRSQTFDIPTSDSGILQVWSPGNHVANIAIVTDLEMMPEDYIADIVWSSVMPDYQGQPMKVYQGRTLISGKGANGKPLSQLFEFPYPAVLQPHTKVEWNAYLMGPDGDKEESGSINVMKGSVRIPKSLFFNRNDDSFFAAETKRDRQERLAYLAERMRLPKWLVKERTESKK